MRTVKKKKMYLLITQERIEISQKFQQIRISRPKPHSYVKKSLKNLVAPLKII
jgi:hypothetical protein